MKLQTPADFSESQKAQIVARGETPANSYTFEMSQKYAAIFSKLQGSYIVHPDMIDMHGDVQIGAYLDATRAWIDSEGLCCMYENAITTGTLKDGASCDPIMQKIEKLLDAKDAASQAAQEKAEEDAARQERERPAREEAEEMARGREARDAEARKAEEADRKATRQAEIDAAKVEKIAWIETHGSERLRKGIAAGYNCHKIYTGERGNAELGSDYILDYDEKIATKDRSCPTLEALNEAERLTEAGIEARVKWLPNGTATEEDCYNYECDMQQSCEAVEAKLLGAYFYMETA